MEELELRRIAYNQKNRELTLEEKEKLRYYRAVYRLGWKDQKGYNFEITEILPKLKEAGLEQYVLYHNPVHPFDWSHTKGQGVDLILEIENHTFYVEMTCLSKNPYRVNWFLKSRVPRFERYPKPNERTHWILLTNMPENFGEKVRRIAEQYSIAILSIEGLLLLITTSLERVLVTRGSS